MTTKKKNEMIVTGSDLPAYLKNMDMEDTRGNENVTTDDLVIPRLGLVQALSPEIKKKEPEYIEGIEQGDLFNTVTREIYGKSVMIIPVIFEKQYLLWKDRDLGGGFGGQFADMDEAVEAINGQEDPENWEVVDTPTHICLVVSGSGVSEIAIPLPKSKAKISRQFNSMIRMLGGPRFSRAYQISGIEDKNSKNQDFWNFRIDNAGFPSEEIYRRAEKLYEDITSGDLKYSVDADEEGTSGTNPEDEKNF